VFSEVLGSAMLMFDSLSIYDLGNANRFPAPQLSLFLLLLIIGAALGWQTSYVCLLGYQVIKFY
jgi:glycerol uptake facilitator-like aquaporin